MQCAQTVYENKLKMSILKIINSIPTQEKIYKKILSKYKIF